MNEPNDLQVLYEDNHLLCVLKPAGVLSQSDGSGAPDLLTLAKDYIKVKYARPGAVYMGLVHRLDRNVGGVLLLARTSKAAARLTTAFRERAPRKVYTAMVEGVPEPPRGERFDLIVKDERQRKARIVAATSSDGGQAREARLTYRLVRHGQLRGRGEYSLLEIELFSGRFHQIRAQMAAMGHPVAGDAKYGARPGPPPPEPMDNHSLFLFASRLEIEHPVKREPLVFEAEPPFASMIADQA